MADDNPLLGPKTGHVDSAFFGFMGIPYRVGEAHEFTRALIDAKIVIVSKDYGFATYYVPAKDGRGPGEIFFVPVNVEELR